MRTIIIPREPIDVVLPCHSRLKKWVYDNAWFCLFSVLTGSAGWVALFILGVKHYA